MDEYSGESEEEEEMNNGIGESEFKNGTRMRLTKRQRGLIPETKGSIMKAAISYF